jgi:hypothetical protein
VYYLIITPNPNFTGDRAGVQIVCGRGITHDTAIADECRQMGYAVVEKPEDLPLIGDVPSMVGADGCPPESLTPNPPTEQGSAGAPESGSRGEREQPSRSTSSGLPVSPSSKRKAKGA